MEGDLARMKGGVRQAPCMESLVDRLIFRKNEISPPGK